MADAAVVTDPLTDMVGKFIAFNKVLTTRTAIAQTPKELVWTLNKAKLYRYIPVVPKEQRHPTPLLLVFALMNRPYILDLRPGHSFVEFMVNSGYDLYLLDWGVPGPEDKNLKFDDYTLDYMPRAIRKMKSIAGVEEFSMLGWCIGAILTTIYAALRPDDGLRNLILLTAPLDFSNKDAITFARWTDERYFDVDKVLATFGNMPGEMIDYGAKALKPVENYIGDLYRNDLLMRGEWMIRGERVDLSNITANLLTVIAEGDHITPPCQSQAILSKVGSADKELFSVPGGHIGIMAGSGANKRTWPLIDGWLGRRSK